MVAFLRGDDIDTVPFVQYDNMNARNEEIWSELGPDSMGVLRWVKAYRLETPNCTLDHHEFTENGQRCFSETITTPKGSIREIKRYVPQMGEVSGFLKHYVQTLDDYVVLLSYLRDITVVEDLTEIEQCHGEIGEGGIPHVSLPRTPYQALWIEWASIDDLALHLYDDPGLLEEVMNTLGKILIDALHVTAGAAARAEFYHVTTGENITAPMIGRQKFRRWCVPYYNQISAELEEVKVPLFVHMDGDLKPLWEDIDECHHHGFDSLSPPPDNDTSVATALGRWPEKFVWANFPSSVHLNSPEEIHATAAELLEEGGGSRRFWIQASEDVPSGIWRKSFPPILKAIKEFGPP